MAHEPVRRRHRSAEPLNPAASESANPLPCPWHVDLDGGVLAGTIDLGGDADTTRAVEAADRSPGAPDAVPGLLVSCER
jgi:hypothetical protein